MQSAGGQMAELDVYSTVSHCSGSRFLPGMSTQQSQAPCLFCSERAECSAVHRPEVLSFQQVEATAVQEQWREQKSH